MCICKRDASSKHAAPPADSASEMRCLSCAGQNARLKSDVHSPCSIACHDAHDLTSAQRGVSATAPAPICMRAHHALCAGFFTGHGYSEDFTRNMERVLAALNEGAPILLCEGADAICAACPGLECGMCRDSGKVVRYDAATLDALGMRLGQITCWAELRAQVMKRVILPGKLSGICPDCQWRELCQEAADIMRQNSQNEPG